MESKTVYKTAPMHLSIIIVSVFVIILFAVIMILMFLDPTENDLSFFAAVFFAILTIGCWQFKPSAYIIDSDNIHIVMGWPFKGIKIPIASIVAVDECKISGFTIRTFGIGGLFSVSGYMWNKQIGSFFISATDPNSIVCISAKKKYIISPVDPVKFVEDLKTRTGFLV